MYDECSYGQNSTNSTNPRQDTDNDGKKDGDRLRSILPLSSLSMSSLPALITSSAARHPRDDITVAVITQLSSRPGPDDGRRADDDEDRRGRRAAAVTMMATIPRSRHVVCLPPPLPPQFPCSDHCRHAFCRPLLSCCLTASATTSCRDITMQS